MKWTKGLEFYISHRLSDLENSFFESIANMIFEIPKQFLGGVLRYALDLKMNERDILSPADVVDSPGGSHAESNQQDPETGDLVRCQRSPFTHE